MIKSITLSNVSNIPIYQQLYDQVLSQIFNKDLEANSPLPSIRTTAKELEISLITVKKAWENLERDGYIYTIPGKGSYISNLSEDELNKKKISLLIGKLSKEFEYYKDLGISKELIIDIIDKTYSR